MIFNKNAFTLIELIVVIAILTILGTIGFINYSSYLVGTRDASRISQIEAIQEGLHSYGLKNTLPNPDNGIDILINSKKISVQGYAGEKVLETIRFSTDGFDPKEKTYYSYYLSKNGKYFQLMAFLEEKQEGSLALKSNINAIEYSSRFPYVIGNKIGIFTDINNTPIQELTGSLNLSNIGNLELKSYLDNTDYIIGTGGVLSTELQKLEIITKVGGKYWKVENNEFINY